MTNQELTDLISRARERYGSETQNLIDEINRHYAKHGYAPASLLERRLGPRSGGVCLSLEGFRKSMKVTA